jgi:hypothetical protein
MFIAALFTIAKLWKWPRCPTTDEWIKKICGIYTQRNFTQLQRRMKFCHLQVNGTRECHLKLVRFRRPKATCFLSYVEYKPNTNTAILWKTDHAKGRSHMRESKRKLRRWIWLMYSLYKNERRMF